MEEKKEKSVFCYYLLQQLRPMKALAFFRWKHISDIIIVWLFIWTLTWSKRTPMSPALESWKESFWYRVFLLKRSSYITFNFKTKVRSCGFIIAVNIFRMSEWITKQIHHWSWLIKNDQVRLPGDQIQWWSGASGSINGKDQTSTYATCRSVAGRVPIRQPFSNHITQQFPDLTGDW